MATNEEIIFELDSIHVSAGELWLRRLQGFAELDRREVWEADGCIDMAQWVAGRYGFSCYRANRYIGAGHSISKLPLISEALSDGSLEVDRAVELCRFATPETEEGILEWAEGKTWGQVKWKADLETKPSMEEAQEIDKQRSLHHWWEAGGAVLGISGRLPAAEGASVAKALDRIADQLAASPEDYGDIEERRADALVLLAKQRLADDGDRDRTTVVVHADIETLTLKDKHVSLEGGGKIHPAILERLLCDCSLQTVLHEGGQPVGIDRISRNVPPKLMRLLRWRDKCCTFPGCEHKRFVDAHHIKWWIEGGLTNIDNLALVCSFHHKLVHEHNWKVELGPFGKVRWFRPDGSEYRPGPDPPGPPKEWFEPASEPQQELVLTGTH